MTIVEFLLARIAEDEAEAENLPAWFNPPKLLAECAAKRAIIAKHEDWPVFVDTPPTPVIIVGEPLAYRAVREMAWLTEQEYRRKFGDEPPTSGIIRILAAVYREHPDYQEDWA